MTTQAEHLLKIKNMATLPKNPSELEEVEYTGSPLERMAACLAEILAENNNPAITERLKYCHTLAVGIEHYVDALSTPHTPLEEKVFQDTGNEDWAARFKEGLVSFIPPKAMMTDQPEAAFLRMITQITKAERILEIGMFTGHSAISFAVSKDVKEVVCLDMEPFFETFLKKRVQGTDLEKKLKVVLGPAMESLRDLNNQGKQFDIVFIDADKTNYLNYYKMIMDSGLLSERGIFLIDNAFWGGSVIPGLNAGLGSTIHEFNEFVAQDDRVEQVVVPIRDGVSIIIKKR